MGLTKEQIADQVAIALADFIKAKLAPPPVQPLVVEISHEAFIDGFTLRFIGQSEDLGHQEALDWFKAHGAKDEDAVNDALNEAFNFYHASFIINHPVNPTPQVSADDAGLLPRI
jgi:hypothetical protein